MPLIPELPEVETIRKQMADKLPLTINQVATSHHGKNLFLEWDLPSKKELCLTQVGRRGKLLWFETNQGRRLYSHLGMSGSWQWGEEASKKKHAHLVLSFKQGLILSFVDPRRFGFLALTQVGSNIEKKILKNLGPDLCSPDFSQDYFMSCLKRYPQRMTKVTLLDQKLFAGVGNYMASEICALAGVRPTRKCVRLTVNEIEKLFDAIHLVVKGMVEANGNTFQGGYQDAFGESGGGLNRLVVFYQERCGMCKKTKVKKVILAGRGTYYCPRCQK